MHHHFDWVAFLTGGGVWNIASYAFQTFPPSGNKWVNWIVGIIQFGLANKSKGIENFAVAKQQVQDEATK